MKLPKAVQSGVQTLAQEDINRPISLANAFADLARTTGGALDKWSAAERNIDRLEDMNRISRDYNKLTNTIQNNISFNLDDETMFNKEEADAIVQKLDKEPMLNEDGERIVPSYAVAPFLHDRFVEQTRNEYTQRYGRADAAKMDASFAKLTQENGNKILQSSFQQRYAILGQQYLDLYNDSVKAFDEETGIKTIQEGMAAGVIEYNAGLKLIKDLPKQIQVAKLQSLLVESTPESLQEADDILLGDNELTPAEEWQFFQTIEKARGNVEKETEAMRQAVSDNVEAGIYETIFSERQPLSIPELREYQEDLTPEAYNNVLKFNNAQSQTLVEQSDPEAYGELSILASSLAVPVEGMSTSQRRTMFFNRVLQEQGLNPDGTVNTDYSANITGDDAAKLMSRANALLNAPLQDPNFERLLDRGVAYLTGGSKDQYGLSGTMTDRINAARFVDDFTEAALNTPNFNAQIWYAENFFKRYGNKDLDKNLSKDAKDKLRNLESYRPKNVNYNGVTISTWDIAKLKKDALLLIEQNYANDDEVARAIMLEVHKKEQQTRENMEYADAVNSKGDD